MTGAEMEITLYRQHFAISLPPKASADLHTLDRATRRAELRGNRFACRPFTASLRRESSAARHAGAALLFTPGNRRVDVASPVELNGNCDLREVPLARSGRNRRRGGLLGFVRLRSDGRSSSSTTPGRMTDRRDRQFRSTRRNSSPDTRRTGLRPVGVAFVPTPARIGAIYIEQSIARDEKLL